MRLLGHVPLLASLILAVLMPLFVGHGLAVHDTSWIIAGLVALLAAAGVTILTLWFGRSRTGERRPGPTPGIDS